MLDENANALAYLPTYQFIFNFYYKFLTLRLINILYRNNVCVN